MNAKIKFLFFMILFVTFFKYGEKRDLHADDSSSERSFVEGSYKGFVGCRPYFLYIANYMSNDETFLFLLEDRRDEVFSLGFLIKSSEKIYTAYNALISNSNTLELNIDDGSRGQLSFISKKEGEFNFYFNNIQNNISFKKSLKRDINPLIESGEFKEKGAASSITISNNGRDSVIESEGKLNGYLIQQEMPALFGFYNIGINGFAETISPRPEYIGLSVKGGCGRDRIILFSVDGYGLIGSIVRVFK